MRTTIVFAVATLAMTSCGGHSMQDAEGGVRDAHDALDADAQTATSPDAALAATAVAHLRASGPAGLDALLAAHPRQVAELRHGDGPTNEAALRHAIDVVSAQRDGHASGLYWYTSLPEAERASRATGKPILSLRMLGRLDEELSCANSRFFRVLVYPDARVREKLARSFILHWSSERAVPHITIDMGDGRTMTRTITGNSAHYVMDADGHVLDVLPGLYDPASFVHALDGSLAIVHACQHAHGDALSSCVAQAHARALDALQTHWEHDLRPTMTDAPSFEALDMYDPALDPNASTIAFAASIRSMSKARIERPWFGVITPADARAIDPSERRDAFNDLWTNVASRMSNGNADPAVVGLVRLKAGAPNTEAVADGSMQLAAIDGARNELVLHARVHRWFVVRPELDFTRLNARVYAELFRTPATDPWLGLHDLGAAYDALEE